MASTFSLLSPPYNAISLKTHNCNRHRHVPFKLLPRLLAISPNRKYYPNTFDDDGIENFQQIHCQATRDGKLQHQDLKGETGDYDGESKVKIVEPKFKMSLAELLHKSKAVPLSVYGDLEVEITGIQQDSTEVKAGDLFVCCVGSRSYGRLYLSEAHRRRAVAFVASKGTAIEDTLGYKTLVIVDDANSVLPSLAATFYGYPSKNMTVIAVTGTNGKTTTTYLIKGLYEAIGVRIGLLGTIAYYIHGDNKLELESQMTTPDAAVVQNLMAKMLHNGAEAVVMEASSHGLTLGRCSEVDFNIAVFTNFTRDHLDFHRTMDEYKKAKATLFQRMVDPERHTKVVNIDDLNAHFFIAQGNPEVPLLTFAINNKNADVHTLKFELSLSGTRILANTPYGVLEISSSLLGRHNIYNILATVAVGIAVGAPLEDIDRGIKKVDAVPGRCEVIDEGQSFGVIVDYAHTPDAVSSLLDFVRELAPKRIITVIGCGGDRDQEKRPIMAKISTDKSEVTILTSDNPRNEDPLDILDDMLAGVGWTMQDCLKHGENDFHPPLPNGHQLYVHQNRQVAIRNAIAMGAEGDMIVIAGKGHETYIIRGDEKEFFDDREEYRDALKYVDELRYAKQE